MNLSEIECKKIFKDAYEQRYTWPKVFNGYKGKCLFIKDDYSYQGEFTLGKTFKPEVNNIKDDEIVKSIASQLFEVSIHRVKRDFNQIHLQNKFQFVSESEKGLEMKVKGNNEGDKYRIKDNRINMVFRKIHGTIIEIFVDEFINTGNGILSKKYTSQQLDIQTFKPKSPKLEYLDNFIKLEESAIWILDSRIIKFTDNENKEILLKYLFTDIISI